MKSEEKASEIKRKKRKPFKAFSLDIKILNLGFKVSKLKNGKFKMKKRIKKLGILI